MALADDRDLLVFLVIALIYVGLIGYSALYAWWRAAYEWEHRHDVRE